MKSKRLFSLVLCALMCAACAVLSQIVIPTPLGVPITLQTFIFALVGYVLGIKGGIAVSFIYICMGAIGIPVFSGFRGGIGCIFGDPTGGFLVGFILLSALCGIKHYVFHAKYGKFLSAICGFFGIILCHICGIAFYCVITNVPILQSIVIVSIPFLAKDILFAFLAYLLSGKVIKALKRTI